MSKITPAISTDPSSVIVVTSQSETGGRSVSWRVQSHWGDRIAGPMAPHWLSLSESDTASRVKRGQGREVWRVKLGDETVFAKVARPTRWHDRIKMILTGSTSHREWRAISNARASGVSVVDALALGDEVAGAKRSVLISHEFESAIDLKQYWLEIQNRQSVRASASEMRELVDGLAEFIATGHKKGFIHRDLHPANILVRRSPGDGFEFRFVDLLGSRLSQGEVGRSAAVRSISQLHQFFGRVSSKTTRLRFLRTYLSHRGQVVEGDVSRGLRRGWVVSISIHSERIAASLSRQRDRRLHRNGKYFAQYRCRDGWRGGVALVLERRHIFPELAIEDRSKQDWSTILGKILPKLTSRHKAEGSIVADGLRWEYRRATSMLERMRWTWYGSPAKQAYIENHRSRHRGQNVPLILGYFQHSQTGLIDLCISVHPLAR